MAMFQLDDPERGRSGEIGKQEGMTFNKFCYRITKQHVSIEKEFVLCQVDRPLKTISSAVHNAGIGWYRTFVNRHVDSNYTCDHVQMENAQYLASHGFALNDTVGMMTAVAPKHVEIEEYSGSFGSLLIVVTAGIRNAVDVSKAVERDHLGSIGTINIWVLINGRLTEEAMLQAFITATEAKTQALHQEKVLDPITNTIASGTSTDSVLIATTQVGSLHRYAGPITAIGKQIGHGVFTCVTRAIRSDRQAKGSDE